jgi:hypothetical protein
MAFNMAMLAVGNFNSFTSPHNHSVSAPKMEAVHSIKTMVCTHKLAVL